MYDIVFVTFPTGESFRVIASDLGIATRTAQALSSGEDVAVAFTYYQSGKMHGMFMKGHRI